MDRFTTIEPLSPCDWCGSNEATKYGLCTGCLVEKESKSRENQIINGYTTNISLRWMPSKQKQGGDTK